MRVRRVASTPDPNDQRRALIAEISRRLGDFETPRWRRAEPEIDYKPHDFESYEAHRLRATWSEIDMNLRSVFDHYSGDAWFDVDSAKEAVSILEAARGVLETAEPNIHTVQDDLGRARRLLIWLVPTGWLSSQTDIIEAQLRESTDAQANAIKLDRRRPDLRFQLDAAIGVLNDVAAAVSLNGGLQRRRLERLGIWTGIGLLVLIVLAPALVNRDSLTAWGFMPFNRPDLLGWVTTFAIAVVGAVGALISAILQVRDRPVTSADYQIRGVEVAVRAGVGSILAILVYVLLSFNVMPGMEMKSPGTYFLFAFLAGFSERWILGVLGVDNEMATRPPTPATPNPAPPPMETAKDMARVTSSG